MVQTRSATATTPSKTDTTSRSEPEPEPASTSSAAKAAKQGDIINYIALAIQCFYLFVLLRSTAGHKPYVNWISPMVQEQGFCVRDQWTMYSSHAMGFLFACVFCPLMVLIYSLLANASFNSKVITNWYAKNLWMGVFGHGVMHGGLAVISYCPSPKHDCAGYEMLSKPCTISQLHSGAMTTHGFIITVIGLVIGMYLFLYYLFNSSPGTEGIAMPLSLVLAVIHALFCPPRVSFTYVLTVLQVFPILTAMFPSTGREKLGLPAKDEYYRLWSMVCFLVIALSAWLEPLNCQTSGATSADGYFGWYYDYGGHVIFDITVASTTVVFVHFAVQKELSEA